MHLNRTSFLESIKKSNGYDVIIIGGGATGLGIAVDAASRGYSTLLLEQEDFAKGTSSRSTKLIHGGVRYLQQGNISLVLEALRERGILIKNAPHLVKRQAFLIPNYRWWEGPFYGIGLKIYDLLAGSLNLGPSRRLSYDLTIEKLPSLGREGLRGGILYYDGQFDDSRLAIHLARTAVTHGAHCMNYSKVIELVKQRNKIRGVRVSDQLTGEEYEVPGRVIVNATGVFTDDTLEMDTPESEHLITPSQGIHLVIDKKFSPGDTAIMIPKTDDGRVLFAVPWHGKVLLGTTDTPVDKPDLEPVALEEEVDFILKHASRYLSVSPSRKDVRSVFVGLRPLVKGGEDESDTSSISRDHTLFTSESGLVTITGGKWTTYRKMAKDTVDQASHSAGLPSRPCITEELKIHGWTSENGSGESLFMEDPLHHYGTDKAGVEELIYEEPELGGRIHPRLPYLKAEVIWGVRYEMAMTVEDILSRRTRSLLLDARASIESAPDVAQLMARELKKDQKWIDRQIEAYEAVANNYLI